MTTSRELKSSSSNNKVGLKLNPPDSSDLDEILNDLLRDASSLEDTRRRALVNTWGSKVDEFNSPRGTVTSDMGNNRTVLSWQTNQEGPTKSVTVSKETVSKKTSGNHPTSSAIEEWSAMETKNDASLMTTVRESRSKESHTETTIKEHVISPNVSRRAIAAASSSLPFSSSSAMKGRLPPTPPPFRRRVFSPEILSDGPSNDFATADRRNHSQKISVSNVRNSASDSEEGVSWLEEQRMKLDRKRSERKERKFRDNIKMISQNAGPASSVQSRNYYHAQSDSEDMRRPIPRRSGEGFQQTSTSLKGSSSVNQIDDLDKLMRKMENKKSNDRFYRSYVESPTLTAEQRKKIKEKDDNNKYTFSLSASDLSWRKEMGGRSSAPPCPVAPSRGESSKEAFVRSKAKATEFLGQRDAMSPPFDEMDSMKLYRPLKSEEDLISLQPIGVQNLENGTTETKARLTPIPFRDFSQTKTRSQSYTDIPRINWSPVIVRKGSSQNVNTMPANTGLQHVELSNTGTVKEKRYYKKETEQNSNMNRIGVSPSTVFPNNNIDAVDNIRHSTHRRHNTLDSIPTLNTTSGHQRIDNWTLRPETTGQSSAISGHKSPWQQQQELQQQQQLQQHQQKQQQPLQQQQLQQWKPQQQLPSEQLIPQLLRPQEHYEYIRTIHKEERRTPVPQMQQTQSNYNIEPGSTLNSTAIEYPTFQYSGQQMSGQQMSGQQMSGQQMSGQQMSGQQMSGQQTSGQQMSGQHQMSGQQVRVERVTTQHQDSGVASSNRSNVVVQADTVDSGRLDGSQSHQIYNNSSSAGRLQSGSSLHNNAPQTTAATDPDFQGVSFEQALPQTGSQGMAAEQGTWSGVQYASSTNQSGGGIRTAPNADAQSMNSRNNYSQQTGYNYNPSTFPAGSANQSLVQTSGGVGDAGYPTGWYKRDAIAQQSAGFQQQKQREEWRQQVGGSTNINGTREVHVQQTIRGDTPISSGRTQASNSRNASFGIDERSQVERYEQQQQQQQMQLQQQQQQQQQLQRQYQQSPIWNERIQGSRMLNTRTMSPQLLRSSSPYGSRLNSASASQFQETATLGRHKAAGTQEFYDQQQQQQYQWSPSVYFNQSRTGSSSSLANGFEMSQQPPRFVRDTSKYWHKPHISREDAINLLLDKPSGSFVVRNSNTYPGSFGLALKVSLVPPSMQTKGGDPQVDLIRHFLIEPTPKGVKLKGCSNEPVFGSLAALIYQHSVTPLSLPCKLLLPETDIAGFDAVDCSSSEPSVNLLNQGAVCNVLYVSSVETESLTGLAALSRAINEIFESGRLPQNSTTVQFKVTRDGITLTDNKRRLFFRRHYPLKSVTYCGVDAKDRRWTINYEDSTICGKCFGFVARKPGTIHGNVCHVFLETDPQQPASAIVNFLTRVLIGQVKFDDSRTTV